MYLFKKNNDNFINIYSFIPNDNELIEYKKKYLENIKSVILHIKNKDTKDLVYNGSTVMFNALDRKEKDGRVSFIEQTNNSIIISKYIEGDLDYLDPLHIVGDQPRTKSIYSGELINEDSTLLFEGGYDNHQEFITSEGVLLTGILGIVQPLLSDYINNLFYSDTFTFLDDEKKTEFLKMFKCKKEGVISLNDLKFLQEKDIIRLNDSINDTFDKSEEIINSYNKAQERIRKK